MTEFEVQNKLFEYRARGFIVVHKFEKIGLYKVKNGSRMHTHLTLN